MERARGMIYPPVVYQQILAFAKLNQICGAVCLGRKCENKFCNISHDVSKFQDQRWFKGDTRDSNGFRLRNLYLDSSSAPEREIPSKKRARSRSPSPKDKRHKQNSSPQPVPFDYDAFPEPRSPEPKSPELSDSSSPEYSPYSPPPTCKRPVSPPPAYEGPDSDPTQPSAAANSSIPANKHSQSVMDEVGDDSDSDIQETYENVKLEDYLKAKHLKEEAEELKQQLDELQNESYEQRVARVKQEKEIAYNKEVQAESARRTNRPLYTFGDMKIAQKVLGVVDGDPSPWDTKQIDKAFRKTLLKVHPDKCGDNGEQMERAALAKELLQHISQFGLKRKWKSVLLRWRSDEHIVYN